MLTETQIDTKIAAIDVQLDAIVASPDTAIDYSIGEKRVSKSQKVEWLMKLRQMYVSLRALIPYEAERQLDININIFGDDDSEYLGSEFE